jgi:hypothetical protein
MRSPLMGVSRSFTSPVSSSRSSSCIFTWVAGLGKGPFSTYQEADAVLVVELGEIAPRLASG